jgi:hypothetical protein
MMEATNGRDGNGSVQASADRALEGYRERRRRRRGEDTYFGSLDCLLPSVDQGASEDDISRRRQEIIAEAEEAGMSMDLAERLYEVAREEGVDPALAFELVRCGLGVAPPTEGITNQAGQPTADKYLPEWMFPPVPTDALLRERMLRMSFRRLRSLLERHDRLDDAFRAFDREPDVGHFGY